MSAIIQIMSSTVVLSSLSIIQATILWISQRFYQVEIQQDGNV